MIPDVVNLDPVMRGAPDAKRLADLAASCDGVIEREEDGITIREYDPGRAPPARAMLRRTA